MHIWKVNCSADLAGVHLSALISSVSDDAIKLITTCFYIPPSLRSKSAVTGIPPSAGTRETIQSKSMRRYSGLPSNLKPASNYPPAKSQASITTGAVRALWNPARSELSDVIKTVHLVDLQRKLEMNNQDAIKNDNFSKSGAKQPPRYRPPARNSPTSIYNGKVARGVSETVEKLATMTVGSARVPARQAFPAPMKAGGWHGQSDLFLGRTQEIQPGKTFTRKVVG
ncbi:hypothetical protein Acr_25g0010430 [Actinidia rufa]|uniref:Uncharacterized protein n=1 Tax=Actinidia rufa TaxID=165716 RepID=A0A7J0H1K1_9ERIC|nr:hypothetical protein Acr_25g0010430 [Actinidia rufa]